MYSTVISASIYGVESRIVRVEAYVSEGLPSFAMVGYLSTQVKEAQERVRTALKNSGIYLTPKKIAVNLAPADLKKSGTGFDLPIAVAIAAAYGFIGKEVLKETFIVGELGLNGAVNPVPGIYAMISELKEQGCVRCIVPRENVREAKEAGQVEVIGVSSLQEAVYYLQTGTYEEVSYEEEDEIGKAKKYQVDFDTMKSWYDGYVFPEAGHIYNPKSVVDSIRRKCFASYWTQTETYEALKIYIELNYDGLKDAIIQMLAGERISIDYETFQNDMTTFKSRDDVLTLLVHLGYLAYDSKGQQVFIPNAEIRAEFVRAIKTCKWKE